MRFIAPAGKWIPREEAVNRVRPEIWSSPKWGTFVREPLVRGPARRRMTVSARPFRGLEAEKLSSEREVS